MSTISSVERDRQLRDVPASVHDALARIHGWAQGHVNLDNKLAVDALFTYLAEVKSEREQLLGEVWQLRHQLGIEDGS